MKVLRIRLAIVALLALTVLLVTSTHSTPAAKRATTTRVAPAGLLSAGEPTRALPGQSSGGGTAPVRGRNAINLCLTATAPNEPPPPPGPAQPIDSAIHHRRFVREGNVIRFLPNEPTPQSMPAGRGHSDGGALDQGNDACPATVIPSLPYRDTGTMRGKHNDYLVPCYPGALPDVVYQYTATQTGLHAATLAGHISYGAINIRTGGACPGTNSVACMDDSPYYLHLVQTLTAGVTYYFVVEADTGYGYGDYEFSLTNTSACNPDAELIAPGSVSGNTCFARDDCPLVYGEDQLVRVTIPRTGRWQFGLCDGERWNATMLLLNNCCTDTAICRATYGCPWSEPYYSERPKIWPRLLTAGTYYIAIESGWANECGPWTLTIEELPSCTGRPPNDDCANAGPPATLPATFTGDNTCATHDCSLITEGQGETWHAFQIDTVSSVVLELCGSGYWFYSMAEVLATDCGCHHLIQASDYTDGECESYGEAMVFRNLQPGTYYYPVIRDSTYGSEGPYTLTVRRLPACHIESQPGDVIECLDTPDLARQGIDCDKGCSNTNGTFQTVEVGQTIYGRSFTWMNGNYRQIDYDYFEFTLPDTARVTVTIEAEFPFYASVQSRECRAWTYPDFAEGYSDLPCGTVTMTTRPLRPHTYALVIQPGYYLAPTDTLHYRATITSESCDWPIAITEQPGDQPEGEPTCADNYNDTYNPGCDGSPDIYLPIACGDTILGTSGVFHVGNSLGRDMDWFRFTITERSVLTMSVQAEFDPYLILSGWCPGCDGGLVETWGYAGEVVRATTQCVAPGEYIAGAFPKDWAYLPCGTPYRMWITCSPCEPCTDIQQPFDVMENEPPCSTNWMPQFADHFNGGCNSDPPVFGPELHCGQTYSGKAATVYDDNGPKRDTDWMPITFTHGETPRICVVAQFPVITALVGPGGGNSGCDNVLLYSDIATGNSCDTVCVQPDAELAPGTYWLFVAPNAYSDVLCGAGYRAWITCDPCTPQAVSTLTAYRQGEDVVLRWSTDPDFAGTYSIYHSNTFADWPSGDWELLAQNIGPALAQREMYIHAGAAGTLDTQYYVVVRVCP